MKLVTALVVSALSASMQGERSPADPRPSFLVLRVDDARADDLAARRPDGTLVLRNVDALITSCGMTFTNDFASLSLCCPSRAAVFSGQYAHNNGVYGNFPPFGGAGRFDHANSLPVWMQAAGYFTGHIGKYMNGHDGSPVPGWDLWVTRKDQANQGYYYDYSLNENGSFVSYGHSVRDYATDVFTQKALRFIDERPFGARPFLLFLDYTAPHAGGSNGDLPVPAARHRNVFSNATLHWPHSFDEEDVSDKPTGIQELPELSQEQIDSIAATRRARLGTLLAVDEGVGQILQSLVQHGLASNTYVIFLSDNGFMEGEHRIPGGKNAPYEESVRVPLAITGPGIPKSSRSDQLVGNIDIAPTILDLAGASSGRTMDGLSLVPIFGGGSIGRQDFLLEGYTYTTMPTSLRRSYSGLRTADSVYIETDENGDGVFDPDVDAQELYLLEGDAFHPADPWQMDSRHSDPIYAALLGQLHERLFALEGCRGAGCR